MADQVFRADSHAHDLRWVLERLLEILDTAVSLQPETESVLRRCEAGGTKNAVLARQAGRLTSALLYLVDRANALPGCLVVDEARGLLRYHHRLLAESLERAFGPSTLHSRAGRERNLPDHPDYPAEPAASLGEPGARLRRLRSLIATSLGEDRPEDLHDGLRASRPPIPRAPLPAVSPAWPGRR